MTERPVCPECAAGKHRQCDGLAWDPVADRLVGCTCETRECAPSESE